MNFNKDTSPLLHGSQSTRTDKLAKTQKLSPIDQLIFQNANYGILILDLSGVILNANPTFEKMLGFATKDLIGKINIFSLHDSEEIEKELQNKNLKNKLNIILGQCLKGLPEEREWTYLQNDGSKLAVKTSITPIQDTKNQITGYLLIVSDISERKKIDNLKAEFISTVSHELRTPLTSIKGSLGLLQDGLAGELSAESKDLVDIAMKNSERLILLINDMLDIQKLESGYMKFHFQFFDIVDVIETAIHETQKNAKELGIEIDFVKNNLNDLKVKMDKDRIKQVMVNLISNAIKFTQDTKKVTVAIEKLDNSIRVSVHNFGFPISESSCDKIFQKFSQIDSSNTRKKGGTGLGLSICKAIIDMHHGKIDFLSTKEKGTMFFFELSL